MTDARDNVLQFPRQLRAVPSPAEEWVLDERGPVEFGKRKRGERALGNLNQAAKAALWLAGEADAKKDALGKKLSGAERAALGDRKHICPSLYNSLAARVGEISEQLARFSEEARSIGLIKEANVMREHATELSILSLNIELAIDP